MDLNVYTVCFNEEMMLPHFLNYYSRLAAKIVVYDNKSADRSVEIALSYPNVEVESFDTNGVYSEFALTRIRNRCWKRNRSGYAIVCDVDEFLYCDDLPAFLAARSDYDMFRPVGFDMVADEFPGRLDRLITEQVKFGCPSPDYSKTVLFRADTVSESNFGPGSHESEPEGPAPLKIYDAAQHGDDLKLLHCKNVGFDYRLSRNWLMSTRVGGEEFEQFGFGEHYTRDLDRQSAEYDDLKRRAKQVVP